MRYRNLLQGLVDELAKNPHVSLEDHYLGQGLDPEDIQELADEHGVVLPASVRVFYSEVNGAVIHWRSTPEAARMLGLGTEADSERIGGRVNVFMLDELLAPQPLQDTPFAEGVTNANRLTRFRPFDWNVEEAFVGFLQDGSKIVDRMVYLRQYDDLTSLDCSLAEYIQAMAQVKAFFWWQDAFASRPAGSELYDLYRHLPRLFPGKAFDGFHE
jgi:hypothetical protein